MSRLSKLLDSLQSSQLAQHLQVSATEHDNITDTTSDNIHETLIDNITDTTSDNIDRISTGNKYNTDSLDLNGMKDFIDKLDKPTHSSNHNSQLAQTSQLERTNFLTDSDIDNNTNNNTHTSIQLRNTQTKPLAKIALPRTNGFRTSLSDWSHSSDSHGLQSNINRQLDTSWADLNTINTSQSKYNHTTIGHQVDNQLQSIEQYNQQHNQTQPNHTTYPNTQKGNQNIYTEHQSEYQSLVHNAFGNSTNLYSNSDITDMGSNASISQTFLVPNEIVNREYNIVEQMVQQEAHTLKDTVLSVGFDYLANQPKPITNILTFNNLSDKQNNEINEIEQKIDNQTLYHNYNIRDLITVKADSNTNQTNYRKIRPVLRR